MTRCPSCGLHPGDADPCPNCPPTGIRPLRRIGPGVWKSADGRWAFLRHESDPHPKRWLAYLDDHDEAQNMGGGEVTLRDVARFAARVGPD